MNIEVKLESAFGHRCMPKVLTDSTSLFPSEKQEINRFSNMQWSDITCDDVNNIGDAIYHFSGEAFCFFLPGFLLTGVRSNNRELVVYDYIIDSLDRSPVVEYWDSQFLDRWPLLTPEECSVVQEWLLWLFEEGDDLYVNVFDRCFETLELLKMFEKPEILS